MASYNKKCILFSRCSTESQDIIQQTNDLISTAHLLGYSDENIIIIENKESAVKLSFEEREGITQLVDTIKNEQIDRVIIYEVSRIARRQDVFYKVRDLLIEKKIQLQVLTPSMLMLNEDGTINENTNLLIGIFLSMAESEGRIRKARFARGKARSKELGKALHIPLFGYTTDKNKYLIPDPVNSQVIKWIFDTYVNTETTLKKMAEQLISNGTFSCSVATLTVRLSAWINNECFIGKKPYPAIISKELFYKAKEKAISQKTRIKTGKFAKTDEIFLCKNLVYMMGTNYKLGTTGKEDKKYKKTGKSTHLPKSMPSINKNQLDPLVLELSINIDKRFQDKERIKAQLMAQEKELQRCKLVCVNKMKAARDKIDKVEERLIEGNLSETKATELSNKYKKEYESEHEKFKQYEESIRNIITQVTNLYEQKDLDYSLLSEIEKYDLVHKHIKRIDLLRISPLKIRINIEDKYSNYYIYEYHTRSTDLDYGCKLIFEGKDISQNSI